ncbi:MAG TPA: Flp family type IVb pilin [Burkholderiaceae bacterium]|jgi:pilus assembly protein Flp/PilA|nr:Flp family type IVb pilin [Burkholderiaceae bacterium]
MNAIKNFICDEDGAAAVEYGLLAALIAAVVIFAVTKMGSTICGVFNGINVALKTGTYAFTACTGA